MKLNRTEKKIIQKYKIKGHLFIISILLIALSSCDPEQKQQNLSEDYYTGGKNGTVFINSSKAYEQPVENINGSAFLRGEQLFEGRFVLGDGSTPFSGLGPCYIRSCCKDCHPSYGHGRRMDRYNADDYGNGYLLVIYDDNGLLPQFTGMPQTRAIYPFLPPIEESGIHIIWNNYTDEFGNYYPDGETYSLIYPTVTIDHNAILSELRPTAPFKVAVEATIGIYGTGLLDAISEQDLISEHATQQARTYCRGISTLPYAADEFGQMKVGRYTYGCTRSTLQNGPGANAIWNITNVTRPDRTYHYITDAYANAMADNQQVRDALGWSRDSVYNYLMNKKLPSEMTMAQFDDFMVWHRGLAVPAARNLDDPKVQSGKRLFYSMGCTACHKPSWTTSSSPYMPSLANQKIWPYTDLLRHDLDMYEPGFRKICRTTPLWGRGLSRIVTGYNDRLHDMRARSVEEAILWHGGEAYECKVKFRNLTKEQRSAVVKFIEAI